MIAQLVADKIVGIAEQTSAARETRAGTKYNEHVSGDGAVIFKNACGGEDAVSSANTVYVQPPGSLKYVD
jgi:hypothetical protein